MSLPAPRAFANNTPSPLLPDTMVGQAVSAALRVHELPARDVVISLVFGSLSRADAQEGSDVDLIHLCWREHAIRTNVEFIRLRHNGTQIDTNVVQVDRLNDCFADPTWSYRFYRARPLAGTNTRPMDEIVRWLGTFNDLIASDRACCHRASVNLGHLQILAQLLADGSLLNMLKCFVLAEVSHLAPFVLLDITKRVPFATARYPEDETARVGADSRLLDAYMGFQECLRLVSVIDCRNRSMDFATPARAQRLRRYLRRIIEHTYLDALGKGYLYLLSGSEARRKVADLLETNSELQCRIPGDTHQQLAHLCNVYVRSLEDAVRALSHAPKRALGLEHPIGDRNQPLRDELLPWDALWPSAIIVRSSQLRQQP